MTAYLLWYAFANAKHKSAPNWRPDDDICRGSAKLQQVRDDDEFFEL